MDDNKLVGLSLAWYEKRLTVISVRATARFSPATYSDRAKIRLVNNHVARSLQVIRIRNHPQSFHKMADSNRQADALLTEHFRYTPLVSIPLSISSYKPPSPKKTRKKKANIKPILPSPSSTKSSTPSTQSSTAPSKPSKTASSPSPHPLSDLAMENHSLPPSARRWPSRTRTGTAMSNIPRPRTRLRTACTSWRPCSRPRLTRRLISLRFTRCGTS